MPTVDRNRGQQKPRNRGWYTKYFSKLDVPLNFPWKNMVFLSVRMQNKLFSSLTQLSRFKPFQTAPRSRRKMPTFLYPLKCSETLLSKQMTVVSTLTPCYSHHWSTVLHAHTRRKRHHNSCWTTRNSKVYKFKVFDHEVNLTSAKKKKIMLFSLSKL